MSIVRKLSKADQDLITICSMENSTPDELVEALDAGANPNLEITHDMKFKVSPSASQRGNVNQRDVEYFCIGGSPLHLLSRNLDTNGRVLSQMMRHLIKAGASIEGRSHTGHTPLHLASLYAARGSALALIDCGADVNTKLPPTGVTPLMLLLTGFNSYNNEIIARHIIANDKFDSSVQSDKGLCAIDSVDVDTNERMFRLLQLYQIKQDFDAGKGIDMDISKECLEGMIKRNEGNSHSVQDGMFSIDILALENMMLISQNRDDSEKHQSPVSTVSRRF